MKKILYISYDGMTDHLGQSQVLPYLKELSIKGYKFTILSCEKREKYEKHKNTINRLCQESSINWQPIFYTKRPPVLSTLKDVLNLKKKALSLHAMEKFDATHCRSYIAGLVGLTMKQKKEVAFVFDMRGFYAEEKTEVQAWPLSNPIYKQVYNFFKRKEKAFFQSADGVVSLTQAGKKVIENWGIRSKDAPAIKVIPCSVDFDHFSPLSPVVKAESRALLGIAQDAKVISFLGSLGAWYMLDEMLDFFKIYLQKYPKAQFLFITSENPDFIKNRARNKGINPINLFFIHANRAEVPSLLMASDVGLFFIKPYFSKKGSSPTKLGEYLALNIPVFTNVGIGDVDDIIKQTGGGVLVEEFTEERYLQSVEEMDKLSLLQIGLIRDKAHSYYDLGIAVENYLDVYRDALKNKK